MFCICICINVAPFAQCASSKMERGFKPLLLLVLKCFVFTGWVGYHTSSFPPKLAKLNSWQKKVIWNFIPLVCDCIRLKLEKTLYTSYEFTHKCTRACDRPELLLVSRIYHSTPTAELEPLSEGQIAQTDEVSWCAYRKHCLNSSNANASP